MRLIDANAVQRLREQCLGEVASMTRMGFVPLENERAVIDNGK